MKEGEGEGVGDKLELTLADASQKWLLIIFRLL